MSRSLLIRADADVRIGIGHEMRCLALAQGWRRAGGTATFASATSTPTIERRLNAIEMPHKHLAVCPGSLEDATQTAALAHELGARWVVVDGYHFDVLYQRRLRDAGVHVLLLDDCGNGEGYVADIILNQNISASEALYQACASSTRLLLGTRYTLLQEHFLAYMDWRRVIQPTARRVLVTLGGSDPDNATLKVVNALKNLDIPGVAATVVAGGSYPYHTELCNASRDLPVSIIRDTTSMPDLMAQADVAIAAGGTISWELAFMGLPSLLLILAENQRGNAEGLDRAGIACNLGWHQAIENELLVKALSALLRSWPRRSAMSSRGRQLVDGHGCARVVSEIW